ncbi:MAG: Mrp/NBP35 family ATP-binding protein [Pirellulales bacterium]
MAAVLPNEQTVRAALADFRDPETGRNVVETGQLGDISVQGDTLRVSLGLTTYSAVLAEEIEQRLAQRLKERFGEAQNVSVELTAFERPPGRIGQIGLTAKSVIAVGSGKGGVGKSTIATALALGLSRAGSTVGLMDADVYGPSIPHLLGVNRRPEVVDNRIQPIEAAGLKVISMGFLVPPGEAVVWRGPMLHGAITQFLRDTAWGELDYLIIDLPPGTGDIVLTLSQLLPLSGAVVVCTPQDVALLDAVKAVAMFRKVNIPILGMVENMSGFVCPDCGKRYDIFGSGGARTRAAELEIPFLGEVPINMQIRVLGDEGRSSANFDDPLVAASLLPLCRNLVRNLAENPSPAGSLPVLTV